MGNRSSMSPTDRSSMSQTEIDLNALEQEMLQVKKSAQCEFKDLKMKGSKSEFVNSQLEGYNFTFIPSDGIRMASDASDFEVVLAKAIENIIYEQAINRGERFRVLYEAKRDIGIRPRDSRTGLGPSILVKPTGRGFRSPADWEIERAHSALKNAREHYNKLIAPNDDEARVNYDLKISEYRERMLDNQGYPVQLVNNNLRIGIPLQGGGMQFVSKEEYIRQVTSHVKDWDFERSKDSPISAIPQARAKEISQWIIKEPREDDPHLPDLNPILESGGGEIKTLFDF